MNWKFLIIAMCIFIPFVQAATLEGSIYNSQLTLENDVLLEVHNQKYLSKDGTYAFDLPIGEYTLIAQKGLVKTEELIVIIDENRQIYDIFLLPSFVEEDLLWQDTEEKFDTLWQDTEEGVEEGYSLWRYILLCAILIFLLWRFSKKRMKYGPLRKFRKNFAVEKNKSRKEHKQDIADEPKYIDDTIEIIKKHDGRISQKKLRKEMLYLSEAKVSLIVKELEHKGIVEKVKKGRGNVLLLK
ncbi:hypothetical protein HOL21_04870 [Candidatus Woesearchaeota archaeon]|jgi:uncharacterized membrane protein|nr:hypothetical protein [Candidatus Woesearchaeota archaeon]MBT5397519.1 hypothetical protein [Candidatus Woesearchaeota archaeon]MBT5924942.1 hypothetical protein [Candidatus Woesearchaeota archaeon]MBT6367908.1 hypothetical protein [Candidatus Woesearchaeota archaeon]MBT7763132.1 hypothetical protein [Candidatus Woesearchaeota archaeon]